MQEDDSVAAKRAKIEENRCKALEKLKQKMLQAKELQKVESSVPASSQNVFQLPQRSAVLLSSLDDNVFNGGNCCSLMKMNDSKVASNQSFSQYNSKDLKPIIVNSNQRNLLDYQPNRMSAFQVNVNGQLKASTSIEQSTNFSMQSTNSSMQSNASSMQSNSSSMQSNNSSIQKQSFEVDLELLPSCQIKLTPINTNSRNFLLQNFPKRSFPTNGPAILVQLNDFLQIISSSSAVKKAIKLKPSMEKCFIEVSRYNALPEPQKQIKDASLTQFCTYNSLLPFQVDGVLFGISRGGRLLLADDMGLGKTLQAAAISFFYRAEWPLLVICPASLTSSWKEALEECYKPFSIEIRAFWDSKEFISTKESQSNQCVFIVSYDLAAKNCSKVRQLGFKVVIVDECHMLKNKDSKRTKSLAPFLGATCRLILLSGTPALSRPIELFPQLQLVNSRLFSNYTEYGFRYCAGYKNHFGFNFQGNSFMSELQVILERTIMLRRTKEQVLHSLPSKVRKQIFLHVDSTNTARRQPQQSTKGNSTLESELESQMDALELTESSLQHFQASTAKKMASILRYLQELMIESPKQTGGGDSTGGGAEAPKILLFAHYKSTLDTLEEWLNSHSLPSIRIDGETCASKRQNLCNYFQSDPSIKVALLSITAASTGLTLTASSLVIFAELFWNPGTLIQAEDRAHRIGQKDSVIVHYLLGKSTFDDVMWPILVRKMKTLQAVGLGKNEFGPESAMQQQDATVLQTNQTTLLEFYGRKEDGERELDY